MISTLIALPYELARLPLVVVDDSLSDRLSETSGARVTLDRTIGSADQLVGALLRNRNIAERGADRIERSDKLLTAARLEEEAAAAASRPARRPPPAVGRPPQKRKAAQDRAASGLDEADAAEARGQAGGQGARREGRRRQEGRSRPASRQPHRHRGAAQAAGRVSGGGEEEGRAARGQDRARRRPREQAGRRRGRADAERLSDLTEAKKQARKEDSKRD